MSQHDQPRHQQHQQPTRRTVVTGAAAGVAAPAVDQAREEQGVEIRQRLVDWVVANGDIDPTVFATVDWRLVTAGQPITVT